MKKVDYFAKKTMVLKCVCFFKKVIFLFSFFALIFKLQGCSENKARPREITPEIMDTLLDLVQPGNIYLDSFLLENFLKSHPHVGRFGKAYRDFYQKRTYQYIWFDESGLKETAYGLTANLMNVVAKDSAELPYNQRLDSLMHTFNPGAPERDTLETELLLTGMYFYFAERILLGVDESVSRKLGWLLPRKRVTMSAMLDSFLLAPGWDDFERNSLNAQYFKLLDALSFYRKLSATNEVAIPMLQGKPLLPGKKATIVDPLRKRLVQLGYTTTLLDTTMYLPEMAGAVNKARRAYGLKEDSTIDNPLIEALNVPAIKRQQQLLANMERLRWIPSHFEAKEIIFINIPDFTLQFFMNGMPVWKCNVVVGSAANKTVIFSGVMDYVVFSPYWYVPQSIINKEIGLARAKSPAYLKRKNMEWSGGSLREKPGPNNSLGLVKFIFPNSNSIYLHDTPAKDLFKRDLRAFSHGCIRVSEPFELAKKVLAKNQGWTDEKIMAAMNKGVEQKVVLDRKIPVYIGYYTAFADGDGLIHFRKDVYNRDGALLAVMTKP